MTRLRKNHFRCILADPPWRFETWSEKNQTRKAPYKVMGIEKIMALPVGDLATRDSVLLLWAISPMLPVALKVIEAWGFTYKSVAFAWAKTTKHNKWHVGLGYWTRANAEFCLLATRGKPQRIGKDVRQLIVSPVREHSRKPDEQYDLIERLVRGPYLELFARKKKRRGWVSWGNEVTK